MSWDLTASDLSYREADRARERRCLLWGRTARESAQICDCSLWRRTVGSSVTTLAWICGQPVLSGSRGPSAATPERGRAPPLWLRADQVLSVRGHDYGNMDGGPQEPGGEPFGPRDDGLGGRGQREAVLRRSRRIRAHPRACHASPCHSAWDERPSRPRAQVPSDMRERDRAERPFPGLFGRLVLSRAVYHPYFMDTVLHILKCVSYYSSKLLLKRESTDYQASGAAGAAVANDGRPDTGEVSLRVNRCFLKRFSPPRPPRSGACASANRRTACVPL